VKQKTWLKRVQEENLVKGVRLKGKENSYRSKIKVPGNHFFKELLNFNVR
jgi:hypothetical protein